MKTADQHALILANKLRDCICAHMRSFTATEYKQMIASAIMGLYLETARLKWLSVSTGEVKPDDFDEVFLKGIEKHYADHEERYGTC